MSQSALTVTAANPTPPTNLIFVGNTPPLDPAQAAVDDGLVAQTPNAKSVAAANGHSINEAAGSTYPIGTAFATSTAAANTVGAPGAGISNTHEARGSEVVVTATSVTPATIGQTASMSVGPALTQAIKDAGPNASHASSLTPTTLATPTTSAASGASNVSGAGTTLLTVTGTNFNRTSVVNISGAPQPTNYVSATSLTVANALKRTTAGTLPVTVTNYGVVTSTPASNWTLT